MRILEVSKFLHHVGGVETYLKWAVGALAGAGHDVGVVGMEPPAGAALMDMPAEQIWFTPTRDYHGSVSGRVAGAATSIYSPAVGRVMTEAISTFKPDVIHFHGTCYQLTPAVVAAARKAGVPGLLTAHEYKLVCDNQTLYDDNTGTMCTACLGASRAEKFKATVSRSCMKGSRAWSVLGAVEGQVSGPEWRRYDPSVLAPSRFMRDMILADGWPRERVGYLDLAWRADDDEVLSGSSARNNVVFVGRLVPLKGADIALRAWKAVAHEFPDVGMRLLGEGPERANLEAMVRDEQIPRVAFLGHCGAEEVASELSGALVSMLPCQWNENSPFTVRESLMSGVPAMVSNLGGVPEMVGPASGWVLPHDDAAAWAAGLRTALNSGLAGSDELRAEVDRRAITDVDHLTQLQQAMESTCARAQGKAHEALPGTA